MWGREIQESGIRREEIFITTKVWKSYQGYHYYKGLEELPRI
jgi:diketogulonate reductase-like aldo/keto reductase